MAKPIQKYIYSSDEEIDEFIDQKIILNEVSNNLFLFKYS